MSKLELYNIYAGYEESKPVLKDISFFVEKGEFIVLLGTSGCGKTTILNLIAGMIPISAGELYIDGVKSNDTPPRKRNIAMVFQNYALYPTMTAYENYILIGFANKIIWDYPSYESNTITRKQYTYSYINREVNISNELIWKGNLQMKYSPELFFNNTEYVISYDDEPEIELYDRYGNYYFLIAYKEFCDFYDKDGNFHKLESIKNIVDYVDMSDIIDIHDYGITPSIDYSRDIKEQTNIIDGKLTY